MQEKSSEKRWSRWEDESRKFRNIRRRKEKPPETTIRYWQRFLLFVFMQELSKNVLHEKETVDSILLRVIEALKLACGFLRVRIYKVKEDKEGEEKLFLEKLSPRHRTLKDKRKIKFDIIPGEESAVDTLFNKEPLAVDDIKGLTLNYEVELGISGPYAAIPLLVEDKPFGLICADTCSPEISGQKTHTVNYIEYREHFFAFARTVMAGIENRIMFEERNQKIEQFNLIKEFSEDIAAENDHKKLLESFMHNSIKLVGADGGHLKIYNEKKEKLEIIARYGDDVAPEEINKPKEIGFSNYVYEKKEPLLIGDLQRHPFMKRHEKFCKQQGYLEYLNRLKKRNSSIIIPLFKKKDNNEICYGVLDLHGRQKKQFNKKKLNNLMALAGSINYAVDKNDQLETQEALLGTQELLIKDLERVVKTRGQLLSILNRAVKEAHSLNTVLEIIRDSCYQLEIVENLERVCLPITDPYNNVLTTPSVKCHKHPKEECDQCFKKNPIIGEAFETAKDQMGKNNYAFPITLDNVGDSKPVKGVLYLQGRGELKLGKEQKPLIKIITSMAAILIKTATGYEQKIKESNALYKVGKLNPKTHKFEDWFNPIMEQVTEIIGKRNRNFHLVMLEDKDGKKGEKLLRVKATSPLYVDEKEISMKDKLLNTEIPIDDSLCGEVIEAKRALVIPDIEVNYAKKKGEPGKRKYYPYTNLIRSEVGIPLIIKEGEMQRVIGVLIIDSVIQNDFEKLDLKFFETVTNYLATTIHNRQLYEDGVRFQTELSRSDRTSELVIFLNSFFHDIKNPLQAIRSSINLIEMNLKESSVTEYIEEAKSLSRQLSTVYEEFVKNFEKAAKNPENVGVSILIHHALDTVERTTGMNIRLEGNFMASNIKMLCYPVFVELAFRSIISNAEKFSQGLLPEERYLQIDVEENESDESIRVTFESTTKELIPEDKLKTIFKPFERVMFSEPGSGLGLALSELCVKLHNGEIKAENLEEKKAVRFEIKFPKYWVYKKNEDGGRDAIDH